MSARPAGGSVEMLVFGKALSEHADVLVADSVVLVRGRVDHKEADKTCLVVQSVEEFAPSEEEIGRAREQARQQEQTARALAEPLRLRMIARELTAATIEELRQAIEDFPGPAEIWVELETSAGMRRLRLGKGFRVQHTPTLRAELEAALRPPVAAAAR